MAVDQAGWTRLIDALEREEPADRDTYVEPAGASSRRVARLLRQSPGTHQKFLLIGPKGGGKSTELRAVLRAMRGHALVLGIDTNASGVAPAAVSAFDIMYLTGLAFLACLRQLEPPLAQAYLPKLARAYGGDSHVGNVASVDKALEGLALFVDNATPVAAALDLVTTGLPIATAALRALSSAVRLLPDRTPVVSEASPHGVGLATACAELAQLVTARVELPLCVLVDGLEQMNGESAERFASIFVRTKLIANAPWSAVFAAPPCTMTQTHPASDLGYREQAVYGFPPADRALMKEILLRRFRSAGLEDDAIEPAAADELLDRSGSLPRHLIRALQASAIEAQDDDAPRILAVHARRGLHAVAVELARGLAAEDYALLDKVRETGLLPRDPQAANLYADGRILSLPPTDERIDTEWVVHPLLSSLRNRTPTP